MGKSKESAAGIGLKIGVMLALGAAGAKFVDKIAGSAGLPSLLAQAGGALLGMTAGYALVSEATPENVSSGARYDREANTSVGPKIDSEVH